jgi:hypothetical protein
VGQNAAFFCVRIKDRKIERVVGLNGVPRAVGSLGPWAGLAPDGSPLIQRDASLDEIYALDWEAPKMANTHGGTYNSRLHINGYKS